MRPPPNPQPRCAPARPPAGASAFPSCLSARRAQTAAGEAGSPGPGRLSRAPAPPPLLQHTRGDAHVGTRWGRDSWTGRIQDSSSRVDQGSASCSARADAASRLLLEQCMGRCNGMRRSVAQHGTAWPSVAQRLTGVPLQRQVPHRQLVVRGGGGQHGALVGAPLDRGYGAAAAGRAPAS